MKNIWEEVLKKENIQYTDNYFLLGGNSISAIKIISIMKKRIPIEKEIPLSYMFSYPTINALAEKILDGSKAEESVYNITAKQLQKEIQIDISVSDSFGEKKKNCFLTGGNGYLGGYLLRDLIKLTDYEVYCLVRGKSKDEGWAKLKKSLDRFLLSEEELKRVHVVLGDLGKNHLGIEEGEYQELSEKIDCIYHNGALVHFLFTYEELKSANVTGTKEILQFAVKSRIKPVYYMSTISIFSKFGKESQDVWENEDIHDSGILPVGYTQSKWVAEGLIWEAKKRGVPVMVFRLGHIVGDSLTGECHSDDFVFRIVKSCLKIRSYPDMEGKIEPVAVDDVSKSIVRLSASKDNYGKAFHIVNPAALHFQDVLAWAKKKEILLQPVSKKEWVKEIESLEDGAAISPFLHFFDDELWDTFQDLTLHTEKTTEALKKAGMAIQPVSEEMMDKFFSYLSGKGVLEIEGDITVGTL